MPRLHLVVDEELIQC